MANKLFIVPITEIEDESIEKAQGPKYTDRVDAYSGTMFEFPEDLVLPFSGQQMYIVRFFGSESTLTDIEGEADAHTREEYGIPKETIVDWLNDSTGVAHSFSGWMERFDVAQPE
jgi:hypothetical protein